MGGMGRERGQKYRKLKGGGKGRMRNCREKAGGSRRSNSRRRKERKKIRR